MNDHKPRRFYLLTYPRTASNLLTKILALEDQPSLNSDSKNEYYFLPTIGMRLGGTKTAGRHLDEWTEAEREGLMARYQSSYDDLQSEVRKAEDVGRDVFIKEHVPWLIEPVSETKFVFGAESTREVPWIVKSSMGKTRSVGNETCLPDEFLRTWFATFLIRHPALAFPSSLRTLMELEGLEAAKKERSYSIEMTLHWSRTLFDWYSHQNITTPSTPDSGMEWPIILDASDIISSPQLNLRYAKIIGFDPSKLRFSWDPASKEELESMPSIARRMKSTINASSGVLGDKAMGDIDVGKEAEKWRAEFGEGTGRRMESWVRGAMGDYEYLWERRLRVEG